MAEEYKGTRGRKNYRRRTEEKPSNQGEVPYVEAHPELGEIPLDDIDSFVIPARDDKGVSTSVTLNMPPYLYRQAQIITRSGRFPYLDVQDLIRHAIFRHVRFCVSIRHSIPKHIIPALDAMMESCRDAEFRVQVQQVFQELDRQVEKLLQNGEAGEAARLMNILQQRLDGIPDSPRKKEVREELFRRFGYVFTPGGKVQQQQQ